MDMKREWPAVCMAVLNWNGRNHLEILIPTLLEAKQAYQGECRIVILDNPSGVDDLKWVRENFTGLDSVAAPENDFLYSYNWLLERIDEPVVVLLNNDLRVAGNFLEPLVDPFRDGSIFAVSAKSLEWDGSGVSSAAYRLGMHHGCAYWDGFETDAPVYTVFAVGGFMAVDRRKFLELGGFDRLYSPAYGEDSDLCLKAWKRGWPSVYQPKSVVWHREGASWDGKQAAKRDYLMTRAQYLVNRLHFGGVANRIRRWAYLWVMSRRKQREGDSGWLAAMADARNQWRKHASRLSKKNAGHGSLMEMAAKAGQPFELPG